MYEALRASPLWESSALLLTYDEHGGFFDHVPPPSEGVPNPDPSSGADGLSGSQPEAQTAFAFDRLGVRIPTVLVSPWVRRGTCCFCLLGVMCVFVCGLCAMCCVQGRPLTSSASVTHRLC